MDHASLVRTLDFDDDARRRFIVRRYAYDPVRRERRPIVVAVVDSNSEFKKLIWRLTAELQARRAAGADVDPREHISGHIMQPGHLARAANGHLVRRAVEHGVFPQRLQAVELPSNMGVFRFVQPP